MEEEINYDIMRYELDANGYITNVFFGCASGTCGAYEGEVPNGYADLEDWYESNCNILNAWFISDGNLEYDAARAASLQEIYELEEDENGLVHRYEIYGLEEKINQNNEVLKEQFIKETITDKLIEVDNSKALSPNIKLTNVSGKIEIIASNKNMLPNEATTQTIGGIVFEQNDDRSITLNGTSTEAIEYNIAGSSANTTSIFVFKKDVEYYLSSNSYQIIMYNFDGSEREEVYNGTGGAITFTENRDVTQIVLCVPNETTLTDVVIQPQLELGTTSTDYVMHDAYSLIINLTDIANVEYVNVLGSEVYIKTIDNEEEYYAEAYLGMHEGYNVVYALQDVTLELTYYTNALNVEFEVENLEFMQGKGTKHNQFRILEGGSMEAHNGTFSGTITASEGEIGGFTLGSDTFTSSIYAFDDFTQEDIDKMYSYCMEETTLTDEEIKKYDLNEDGEVNLLDIVLAANLLKTNVTKTEPGSLEINSKSPFQTILLKDKDDNEVVNVNMRGIQIFEKKVVTTDDIKAIGEIVILGKETITDFDDEGNEIIVEAPINANNIYEGEWELIDKEFESYQGTKNEGFSNTSNATEPTCYFIRGGHSITFQFGFYTNAQVADSTLQLLTVSLSTIGVNNLYCNHSFILWGDEAQSVAFTKLTYDGKITTHDQLPDAYIAKSRWLEGTITVDVVKDNMLDEACDKFYWKRIS